MVGTQLEDREPRYDVIVVGAGPCGLAVAARMREATPSALFTDVEHQRFHFVRRNRQHLNLVTSNGRANNMRYTKNAQPSPKQIPEHSLLALDATSTKWMGRWDNLFAKLNIVHLRSPLFFHPDPRDRDGLKEYAYAQDRGSELEQLKYVAGKEKSKHRKKKNQCQTCLREGQRIDEREMQDYYTPSTKIFNDYCKYIVGTYGLEDAVRQESVLSIDFEKFPPSGLGPYFSVKTQDALYRARIVIMAIGPGDSPCMPRSLSAPEREGACHTRGLPPSGVSPHVQVKIDQKQQTCVLVIGGGLTSAQVTDLCILRGVSKVYHLMRGPVKTKYFDLELDWVGKYKNLQMVGFWNAENDEERFNIIKEARNGGAITPKYKSILLKHQAKGKLELRTYTTVQSQVWGTESKTWTVTTTPPIKNLPRFDYVYFATGVDANIHDVPMLKSLLRDHPIDTVEGLPCLTDELQWSEDVPLFMTGRFAGLRLGPWAANLEGARAGAERISWKVKELLESGEPLSTYTQRGENGYQFELHSGNIFNALNKE